MLQSSQGEKGWLGALNAGKHFNFDFATLHTKGKNSLLSFLQEWVAARFYRGACSREYEQEIETQKYSAWKQAIKILTFLMGRCELAES